ncbi:amidase [Gordonia sp. HNM0687]|uniref:amidase n=2 Tax=Gordonia mangrovi TaxID=2665643 RepID=A0A6L7GVP1_9ACTN|nr:amidase [Gordonia mangrovi]MXP23537.1 amidase [Gordonia mangrovi]
MDDLTWEPAWRLREMMVAKEVSPVEVTEHFLRRIDKLESTLHAFITVDADGALKQAAAVEKKILAKEEVGPLAGVPLGIKDQFWTKGLRTTGGSLAFDDYVPEEDSVHAERMRSADAVILGKTNTPEFGLYPRTVNRVAGECRNPWDPSRTSGGSSGGSAAAVAAGMMPTAVASDGGGSIRLPAAYCGLFGMHPSSGRVPRHGSFGGSLTTSGVGPVARDVRDATIMFSVLAGQDPRDPSCVLIDPPDYLSELESGITGLRVGWTESYGWDGSAPGNAEYVAMARRAADRFAELGATVEAVDLDLGDNSWASHVLSGADRYAALGESIHQDPARWEKLTMYSAGTFAQASTTSAADYSRAVQKQFGARRRLTEAMEGYDLLLTPTTALPAQAATGLDTVGLDDPAANLAYYGFTEPINFTGFTAASVPCGFIDGLPVGLHVIGRPNDESLVLRASRAFEAAFPWADRRPDVAL